MIALLSRRSDPRQQGIVLGLGQSVSSLSRILGAALGIPMLFWSWFIPYAAGIILMLLGLLLVIIAVRRGGDFPQDAENLVA